MEILTLMRSNKSNPNETEKSNITTTTNKTTDQSAHQIVQKRVNETNMNIAEKEISDIIQEGAKINKKKKMEILALMKESRPSPSHTKIQQKRRPQNAFFSAKQN